LPQDPDVPPLLLQGGRILDPASGRNEVADLLLQDGRIARIAPGIAPPPNTRSLRVDDHFVVPGLIDAHVHLRDPGFPEKETLESGCRSAAAGGFTAVICMPNTDPPADLPEIVADIRRRSADADARVHVVACGTKQMQGREITDVDALLEAGVVGFSDDGLPVEDASVVRDLLRRSRDQGFVFCPHVEDFRFTRGGHMHEGDVSRRLGIKGMGTEGEAAMVERDIDLVREVGGKLHILHISVRRAVDLVRRAKAEGLTVTCEACPHHFTLTDEDVPTFGTAGKMSPPLRSADDRDAVLEGLSDGTIDLIATDHAPHTTQEKLRAFAEAPNGILGLETALGLVVTRLVEPGVLSLAEAVGKMTVAPAEVYGLPEGRLAEGGTADVTVIDTRTEYTVDAARLASKSRNTPFHGWTLRGRPALTVLGGRITHQSL